MAWFPIGPDFVLALQAEGVRRLSRRNELGRQSMAFNLGLDPTDPNVLYAISRPWTGGTSLFRTDDQGQSWYSIADELQWSDPRVDPSCITVNPNQPDVIYLGTWTDGAVYVSTSGGRPPAAWGPRRPLTGGVRKLLVDPRTTVVPASTVLLAATTTGLFRSANNGTTWAATPLTGDIWSLVAHIPATGTAHFYAGVADRGVFHATDPAGPWTNLSSQNIGLPAYVPPSGGTPANFYGVLIDRCPRNPDRVYAWFTKWTVDGNSATMGLWTTSSPLSAWTQVPMTSPPDPWYWHYAMAFAVAPNSPGDGTADILFFGHRDLFRSGDGGRTWVGAHTGGFSHVDLHHFVFFPPQPAAGEIPTFTAGCDGGVYLSTRFADPAYAMTVQPGDYHQGIDISSASGVPLNLNHGLHSSAIVQYASHPSISALSYINCQDTAVAGGAAALGWRSLTDADGNVVAAAPGADGVKVWGNQGIYDSWPGFRILVFTDRGDNGAASQTATWTNGSPLEAWSNLVVGLDGGCLAGVRVLRVNTTLTGAVTVGVRTVTPASMSNIVTGAQLSVDGGANQETVTVTATTATTFTATFAKGHATGAPITQGGSFVARIGQDASAVQISQDFGGAAANIMAASPTNADLLACATTNQRLWRTTSGSTASPSTVWTEITGFKPPGIEMASIAIDTSTVYVMLKRPFTVGGELGITSPLFTVSGTDWVQQECSNLPTATYNFGKVVVDPVQPGVLYAIHGPDVYRLALTNGVWDWQNLSDGADGLPGQWIYDLWIGNVAPAGTPAKVILRAAIPTRGVWERDVTAGATPPPSFLYLRDHLVDQGWLDGSLGGVPNPYRPAERVWHYQCADLKIDARQRGTAAITDFYQTDTDEGTFLPPNHVLFDQLLDNSAHLPQANEAHVHVQVHNRSRTAINNVRVWAIYCRASAGVPSLRISPSQGNNFDFWSQFTAAGQITPNLPADSPWKPVGPPQTLSGIRAAEPKVASWTWTVPSLSAGDPGHYCMAVFVHTGTSRINGPGRYVSNSIDDACPRNRQIGQKNVHIGPPLVPGPGGAGGGGGGGPGGAPGTQTMNEYIEFHNPDDARRIADLIFDLRALPPQLGMSFRLSKLDTVDPLPASVTGVTRIRRPGLVRRVLGRAVSLLRWLVWLLRWLRCLLVNLWRWLTRRPRRACGPLPRLAPELVPTIYEAAPSELVEVRGVRLAPFGSCAARLSISRTGSLPAGGDYRFEVQQRVGGTVVGGSTYVVRIAGIPERPTPEVPVTHRSDTSKEDVERLQREARQSEYTPPWTQELRETREKELGQPP
jgi:hypothetical protein